MIFLISANNLKEFLNLTITILLSHQKIIGVFFSLIQNEIFLLMSVNYSRFFSLIGQNCLLMSFGIAQKNLDIPLK